ncbi:phosphate ABC transporter permease PstA [bacterium]|nr:phosphate ABC transporter permease PstA [bacterium]
MRLRPMYARQIVDMSVKLISVLSSLIGICVLVLIIYEVIARGIAACSLSFFTELPAPPGMGEGGVANAIIGTLIITVLASLIGVPVGLLAGIFLAEFGKDTKFSEVTIFILNVIIGIPSIIIGLFVYTVLVKPFGSFSGYAGAVALAIIMLPVIARTAQDMLLLVPNSLRESAFALGMPYWRVILSVVFRYARSGLTTAILLAIARVSGETAPLLFTALNSQYWIESLTQPTANLTVTIYNYAISPYTDWQQIAWGASLLIMIGVLTVNIFARLVFKPKFR